MKTQNKKDVIKIDGNKEVSYREDGTIRVCRTKMNTPLDKRRPPTQQDMKDQCDVNKIISRYKRTGQITHLAKGQGMYLDISDMPTDFLEASSRIQSAKDAFMTLPAAVRAKFGNRTDLLIEFLKDPNNRNEAIELGLIEKPVQVTQNLTKSEEGGKKE